MTHPRYRTPAWQAARKQALIRDAHVCQLQLPGCTNYATEADHIIRPEDGGADYALSNLQAACKKCNVAKRNRDIARRARKQTRSRVW